ncbi:MAG: hypothetical protein EXR77_10730 [Myxococcales bacterium]|nr:hypothetical protein [Myxococcales bacterium]
MIQLLQIVGENLASLPAFVVDFRTQPLAASRLVGIFGNTGAGKSTILDALCLALYGETPRTSDEKHAVAVGRDNDAVKSNNPMAVVRRGAVQARAEVTFALDEIVYRSVWAASRAGKKADGKWKPVERQLIAGFGVDEKVLADGISDHDAKLPELLGLSAEQFRRTVMLAQGDFAAFLKAKNTERAALLEKLTRGEVFRHLSQQAFAQAKVHSEYAAAIAEKITDLAGASAEIAQGWRDQLAATELNARQNQETIARGQLALGWHEADRKLVQALQARQQELGKAETAVAGLAQDRVRVRQYDAAAPFLVDLQRVRDRTEALRKATGEHAKVTLDHGAADARRASATEQAAAAHQRLLDATAMVSNGAADLKLARALDEQLKGATSLRDAANAAYTESKIAAATAETKAQNAAQVATEAVVAQALARQALDARGHDADVADQSGVFGERLEQLAVGQGQVQQAQKDVATAMSVFERDKDELRKAIETHAGASTRRDAANASWLQAQTCAEANPPDAALLRLDAARSRRDVLQKVAQLLVAVQDEGVRAADSVRLAEGADQDAAQAAQSGDRQREAAHAARTVIQGLDLRIADVQVALSLEDQRHQLVQGKPCPLCGATKHPWALADAPDNPVLTRLKQERAGHNDALLAADKAAADAQKQQANSSAQAKKHRELAVLATERAQKAVTQWRQQAPADFAAAEPTDSATSTALAQAQVSAETELEVAQSTDIAARKAAKLLTETANNLHQADLSLAKAKAAVQVQEQNVVTGQATQDAEQVRLTKAQADVVAKEQALAALWRIRPEMLNTARATPRTVKAQLVALTEELAKLRQALTAAETHSAKIAVELDKANYAAAHAVSPLPQFLDDFQAKTELHVELTRQRAGLLGGLPADDCEQGWRAAQLAAQTATTDAGQALQRADNLLHGLQGQLTSTLTQMAELDIQHQEATATLGQALTAADQNQVAVEQALAQDSTLLKQTREQLRQLDNRLAEAQGAANTAQQQCETHQTARIDELAEAALTDTVQQAKLQHEDLSRRMGALQQNLDADAKIASRRAILADHKLAFEQQAAPFQLVNARIGSATGDKLQRFAQNLTLDWLVLMANRYLDKLSRRYRLQRVPDEELQLQIIDGDRGDEVRPLSTLSGGEGFLVSLALALGLGQLGSRGKTGGFDTLFIDEGFGTLDMGTLQAAVGALKELRHIGSRVVLITHVQQLQEQMDARIKVERRSSGSSDVLVSGA